MVILEPGTAVVGVAVGDIGGGGVAVVFVVGGGGVVAVNFEPGLYRICVSIVLLLIPLLDWI